MAKQTKSRPTSEFIKKLENLWAEDKFVCVGLDPVESKLPKGISSFFKFNKAIIDKTHDLVLAYKPNSAFYEAYGAKGIGELKKTIDYIKKNYPQIPVIIDAKRADIGSTNEAYVKFVYDYLGADAVTLHPYLGHEAIAPFLERADKGAIILVRTSNPGAGEFQDIPNKKGEPLYLTVAKKVAKDWNVNGNCALVVGATFPNELNQVRKAVGDIPFLIPGIGAQGGDVEETVKAGRNSKNQGIIIHSSRAIIFASSGSDFAQAAREKVKSLNEKIDMVRNPNRKKPNSNIMPLLRSVGVIITDDHFVYTSGKHGSVYIFKDALYPHTEKTSQVGKLFAKMHKNKKIDVVVAPALGGIVLSQWTAYHLSKLKKKDILGLYTEKIETNDQIFKRGYDKLVKGKNVLVIEDVTNTGGSVQRLIKSVKKAGGKIAAVSVMVNRQPEKVDSKMYGVPFSALEDFPAELYDENECPLCEKKVPVNTQIGHGKEFLARTGK